MPIAQKTLEAIDFTQEQEAKPYFPGSLGGSMLGRKCDRELWYNFRWIGAAKKKGPMLRLFERGLREEELLAVHLKRIGVNLYLHDPDAPLRDGKPQQFEVETHDGHARGFLDGIGIGGIPEIPTNEPFVVSFKTHNKRSFEKLVSGGVVATKFEHYVQEQFYMGLLKWPVRWALYLATCKDNDEIYPEAFQFSPYAFESAHKRAGNVIYANEPPARVNNNIESFDCRFCDFKSFCHTGSNTVLRNCRTCRFSRPGSNRLWICGLTNTTLDKKAQLAGCGSYQVHFKLQGLQP